MTDFVDDLYQALPEGRARLALGAVLAKYAGCSVYLPADKKRDRRIRAAEHMLAGGMAPSDIASALRQRFQVSERTAQRDVSIARKKTAADGGA